MIPQLLLPAAVATITALICAASAIWLLRTNSSLRFLIPVSGGLLLLVALFGLIPEVAESLGWPLVLALTCAGYLLLTAVDRLAFHVCPTCSHDHDHGHCTKTLHGFGVPLVAAASIHALVDGWGLVTVQVGNPHFAPSISLAILLHKIPEGIALGTMLRAATGTPGPALLLVLAAELPTLIGGVVGLWATPKEWVQYPLALAGGTFLFLAVHALHGEWKMRRARRAVSVRS